MQMLPCVFKMFMSYHNMVFMGNTVGETPTVVSYHDIVVTVFQTIVENTFLTQMPPAVEW
jgi:hypothetical protein